MVSAQTIAPFNILLVEDDPADVELTLDTLEQSKILVHIEIANDGIAAWEYLNSIGANNGKTKPDLLILDLNMPKMDGRELLEKIKTRPELRSIPVVILTTSDAEIDIIRTYNLGASCYVTKPIGLEEFTKVVNAIQEFWFTIVKLPPR